MNQSMQTILETACEKLGFPKLIKARIIFVFPRHQYIKIEIFEGLQKLKTGATFWYTYMYAGGLPVVNMLLFCREHEVCLW